MENYGVAIVDVIRQNELDIRIKNNLNYFLKHILSNCRGSEEAVYATCSLMLDFMRLHMKALQANLPTQEAKAAFKVGVDAFVVEQGMALKIFEFE